MRKVQRDAERLVAENAREEARKNRRGMRRFRARLGKLLAVCITDGDIEIRPLQNRLEFIEEGKAMHHCVATYWGEKDSFILSAKQDGVRIATIEIDMKEHKVVQCRAACNEKPKQYDTLMRMLNENMHLFVRK